MVFKKKAFFDPDPNWPKKGSKTQKEKAKNMLLCPVALFYVIFRHNMFTFLLCPFFSDFMRGLACMLNIHTF